MSVVGVSGIALHQWLKKNYNLDKFINTCFKVYIFFLGGGGCSLIPVSIFLLLLSVEKYMFYEMYTKSNLLEIKQRKGR